MTGWRVGGGSEVAEKVEKNEEGGKCIVRDVNFVTLEWQKRGKMG